MQLYFYLGQSFYTTTAWLETAIETLFLSVGLLWCPRQLFLPSLWFTSSCLSILTFTVLSWLIFSLDPIKTPALNTSMLRRGYWYSCEIFLTYTIFWLNAAQFQALFYIILCNQHSFPASSSIETNSCDMEF